MLRGRRTLVAASPAPVAAASGAPAELDRAFFGHPRGLSTLFFTEMWERFSYYGMRALLILFMTAAPAARRARASTRRPRAPSTASTRRWSTWPAAGRLDRGPAHWAAPGGALRRHPHRAAGTSALAIPAIATFYPGLVLIVFGTGLLKPNVSAIVGQLYATERHAARRGVLDLLHGDQPRRVIAPLVCGWLGQRIELAPRIRRGRRRHDARRDPVRLGGHALGTAGLDPAPAGVAEPLGSCADAPRSSAAAIVLLVVAFGVGIRTGAIPITPTQVADGAGYLLLDQSCCSSAGCSSAAAGRPRSASGCTPSACFFVAATLFWSVFEQAGSTLNLFADAQHVQSHLRVRLSEQLVPVAQFALPHRSSRRSSPGSGSRSAAPGAVEPGEVRARPDPGRHRLRDSDPAAAMTRQRRRSSVRCG